MQRRQIPDSPMIYCVVAILQSTLVNSMFLTDIYSSSFNTARPTRYNYK
jgi:hypothetical protein